MVKGHPWPLLLSSLSKFKRPNHTVAVRIQIISPPLEQQAVLVKVLGLVGISSTDAIAFLMTHLKRYSVF